MMRRGLRLAGGVPALSRLLLFLSVTACYGANVSLPGGSVTVPGTSPSGVSFVYTGTLTQADTIAFVQTSNPCLQTNSGYCTNGAGVLTVAATVGVTPVGGSGSFSGTIGGFPVSNQTYGALMITISGVGTRQVFATNAANGLGSSIPPSSLTLPSTSFSTLGFGSFSVSNPTITFTVGDTDWSDNSAQFVLSQPATTMYGVTGANGARSDFYSIDQTNAAPGFIGFTGYSAIGSLDFAPDGKSLYGIANISANFLAQTLVNIDPSTGIGIPIGPTGLADNVSDLAVRSDGLIFGADTRGVMHTFDPKTGTASTVGSLGLTFAPVGGALAFNSSGTLYYEATEFCDCTVEPAFLYTVNQTTGVATQVATVDFSAVSGARSLAGMKFDPVTGTLFGTAITSGFSGLTSHIVRGTVGGATLALTDIGDAGVALEAVALGFAPPQTTILPATLPVGTINVPYLHYLVCSQFCDGTNWSIIGGALPQPLTLLNQTNGNLPFFGDGVLSGTPTQAGTFTFTVQAFSGVTQAYTMYVTLGPMSIVQTSLPGGAVGAPYSFTLTNTGGVPPNFTWSLTNAPAWMSINSSTGQLTGTPTAAGNFPVTVQVSDVSGALAAASYTVNIINPVIITTTSIPGGVTGVPYSAIIIASGGVPPYTWSLPNGTVNGLSINSSTGQLSGSPLAAGSFTVTVKVTDTFGSSATVPFNLNVINPLSISTTAIPGGVVGVPYSTTIVGFGGVPPYAWSLSFPTINGLTLNSVTGVLSGTPASGGTLSPLVVTVTDAQNTKVSKSFTLRTLAISTTALPNGTVGAAYSATINAFGASPSAVFSAPPGSLPPGLSLNSSGVIGGTPTQLGTFPFTVTLTDVQGFTTQALSITIVPGLGISTSTLPDGAVGTVYTATIQAVNGTGAVTFAVTQGSLPAGLTLASGGGISGTPTATGLANFTVTATDSTNASVSKAFSINITTQPVTLTITTGSLPSGILGSAYSATLAASLPSTWSLGTFLLPAGLNLNTSTGAITGTPTAAGTTTFTVPAHSGAATAQKQFTITVSTAPSVTVTGLPTSSGPGQQPAASVVLSGPYPLNITGTLTLTFLATDGKDNPEVRFASGGRTANFSVPAGSTTGTINGAANIPVITGTVAGTITITLAATDSNKNTIPPGAPITINVTPTVPVITKNSVKLVPVTGGFNVVLSGFSTPKNMVSGLFHFTPTTGNTISPADVTVQLAAVFAAWYASPASNQIGSQFSLTVPFTTSGNATFPVATVTVTLTNSLGASNPETSQ